MNKNISLIVGVLVVLIILGGVYVSMKKQDDAMMIKEKMEQQAMQDKKIAEEKITSEKDIMQKDEITTDVMIKAGSYEVYSEDKVALASDTNDVVLFFRASWCPTCRSLDKNIKENITNIPAGLTILDVNYDSSKDLKQKYGVTYQHTLVQVDKDGNMIKKWSGSPTLLSLVSEVK